MRINHNLASLNTYRQLSANTVNTGRSIEKLSSGLRINRAGDDAAGLAISEKMRAQIRGLDQASRNSQDGISMIQTAEGALSETHSILQRMRELATQSANDTNVTIDRAEIQKEINQLSSEINRIGNTTEFNTQKLLKGDGTVNLTETSLLEADNFSGGAAEVKVQAIVVVSGIASGSGGDSITIAIGGQTLTINFGNSGDSSQTTNDAYNVTSTSATVNLASGTVGAAITGSGATAAVVAALTEIIAANSALNGNITVSRSGAAIVVTAVAGGTFDGDAAVTMGTTGSGGNFFSGIAGGAASFSGVNEVTSGSTTSAVNAQLNLEFSGISGLTGDVLGLVGTALTINGTQIEFYNANNGAYAGSVTGVNLSNIIAGSGVSGELVASAIASQISIDGVGLRASGTLLIATASTAGTAGNDLEVSDGGVQANFEATFQVGANKSQSFTMSVGDMRSDALNITSNAATTGYTSSQTVTNGTDGMLREYSLDVSTAAGATNAIDIINTAIESVSTQRSQLGAYQNRLEHTINNLGTSSENLTAAESRIRDVDMAKEMMEFTKNNILTQAAQAMLAQANQQPQGVLQLLR